HTRFSRDWSSDVCSSDLLGFLVENRTNTVPAVLAHDGEAVALGMLLDHFADIAQTGARTHQFDALVEALLGDAAQAFGPFRHVRSEERRVGRGGRVWTGA